MTNPDSDLPVQVDYRVIFNTASNGMVFTCATTGRIIDVNVAWIRSIGIALRGDEAVRKESTAFFHQHKPEAEEAMRDLRFKIDSRNLNPAELVAEIKRRGVVTFNDYRLLTGACVSGLKEGLRARGKDGAEEMPLAEALTLCADGYGGATFRRLMGAA